MANELILQRLTGVRDMLVALYQSSNQVLNQHPSIIGDEREIFVSHFLSQILPPHYRIGNGVITDRDGNKSTQLDVVIELPFAPSFSFLDGMPRIYLADTIGAVIEIKSDLNGYLAQDKGKSGNVREKLIEGTGSYTALRNIKRNVLIAKDKDLVQSFTIPTYIVGYQGFEKADILQEHINKLNHKDLEDEQNIIRGILQLLPKTLFVGSEGQLWEDGAALGAFINSLHWELHRTSPFSWPDLLAYFRVDNDGITID